MAPRATFIIFDSACLTAPAGAQNFRLTSRRPKRIKEMRTSRGPAVRGVRGWGERLLRGDARLAVTI